MLELPLQRTFQGIVNSAFGSGKRHHVGGGPAQ
jgi:hypothetical protein